MVKLIIINGENTGKFVKPDISVGAANTLDVAQGRLVSEADARLDETLARLTLKIAETTTPAQRERALENLDHGFIQNSTSQKHRSMIREFGASVVSFLIK